MKGLDDFIPDTFFHIVNHAVGNENLFRSDDNYLYFLKKWAYYMQAIGDTYAYCLMPNHIHFLIKTHPEEVLVKLPKYKNDFHKVIMQELSNLLNAYTKAYNKVYNRKGSLWIDFTKRFQIESDSYLTNTINYIHVNPVHHGFCSKPEEWKNSSYLSILSDKPTLLKRDLVLNWYGSQTLLVASHNQNINKLNLDWE